MGSIMPEPLIPIIIILLISCMIWHFHSWNKLRNVLKSHGIPFSRILNPNGLNNDLHAIIDLIEETDSIYEKRKLRRIKNIAQLSFVSPFLLMLIIVIFMVILK
jgi:hypothetical protein